MARGWIHTVHSNGAWRNEVEESGSLPGTYSTKEAAVSAGRQEAMSRETEHVIHNLDGTISERNSYGNDRYPPPG